MPKIEVDVVADVTALGRGLDRGAAQLKGFAAKASGAGAVFKGVLGANVVGKAAGAAVDGLRAFSNVLSDSVGEARESQKVGATTAQIIKSTGSAAKISAGQVGELATAISNKTGMDDEAIQAGSNLLLTFKNVRNEAGKGAQIFNRATQAAVDLSAAGFGSVTGASKMLGKALNDPVKGISALGRAGVTFTEQQKTQIAAMVKVGDTLGAQKIIMKEVESQVGGVGAASATAGEKMKVMADNLKEQFGTALLPVLDRFAKFFTTTLGPAISGGITKLGPLFAAAETLIGPALQRITALVSGLAPVFTALAGVLGPAMATIGQTVLTSLTPVFAALVPIVTVLGTFLSQMAGTLVLLLPPILAVGAALLTALLPVFQALTPSLLAVAEQLVVALLPALTSILPLIPQLGTTLTTLVEAIAPLLPSAVELAVALLPLVPLLVDLAVQSLKVVDAVVPLLAGLVKFQVFLNNGLLGALQAAGTAFSDMKTTVSDAWDKISSTVKDKTKSVITTVKGIPGKITSALSNLGTLLVDSGKAMLKGLAQGIRDGIGDAISAAKDAVSAIRDFFPFSPAKDGPFSGKGWTLYSGRAIGAALSQGMLDSRGQLTRSANSLAEAATVRSAVLSARVLPGGSGTARSSSAGTSSASGPAAVAMDAEAIAAAVADGIARGLRALDPRGAYALVQTGSQFGRARGGAR